MLGKLLASCCLLILLWGPSSLAATVRWINPAGGNYEDGGNWDTGTPPTLSDTADFTLPGPYTVRITQGGNKARFRLATNISIDASGLTVTLAGLNISDSVQFVGGTIYCDDVLTVTGSLELTNTTLRTTFHNQTFGSGSSLTLNSSSGLSGNSCTFSGSQLTVMQSGMSFNCFGTNPACVTHMDGAYVHADCLGFSGTLTMVNHSELHSNSDVVLNSCTATMSGEGTIINPGASTGGNSSLVIGPGATSRYGHHNGRLTVQTGGVAGGGSYYGPTTVAAGGRATFGGFFGGLHADQASIINECYGLQNGFTLDIDGLNRLTTPFVYVNGPISGTFVVNVRNPNALRVGMSIPIVKYPDGPTSPTNTFSSFTAPSLGGGRVLTLFDGGSPRTLSIRVSPGGNPCWSSDFDGDGDSGTDADIEAFFACLGGICCSTCASADFNSDGFFGTDADIEGFFRVLAGAPC